MDSMKAKNDLVGKWIATIGLPSIIMVGIIGNVLAFLVYSRKFFSKTSCGFYFKAISISDTIYLVLFFIEFMALSLDIDLKVYSDVSCKLIWFLSYIPPTISSWIEALVSFDRMINITAPKRLLFLRRRKFSNVLLIAVIAVQTIIYTPLLHFFGLVEMTIDDPMDFDSSNLTNVSDLNRRNSSTTYMCTMKSQTFAGILSLYDLIYSTLAPFAVMSISTTAILIKVYNTRRNMTANAELKVLPHSHSTKTSRDHKDFQFAITSVSLCLLYFFLNIGITSFNLLSAFDLIDYEIFELLFSIALVVCVSDYSLKFYVYLLVNSHFRAEFKKMFQFQRFSILAQVYQSQSKNDRIRVI